MPPFSICIGRQLASGGRAVGQRLARSHGATYYDRE
ncbi:MAG: cytidylate kinase family protein, partial [Alloprevotella sp.]|nr:cytidylate kinase family protein [Alloprevotella sp.]